MNHFYQISYWTEVGKTPRPRDQTGWWAGVNKKGPIGLEIPRTVTTFLWIIFDTINTSERVSKIIAPNCTLYTLPTVHCTLLYIAQYEVTHRNRNVTYSHNNLVNNLWHLTSDSHKWGRQRLLPNCTLYFTLPTVHCTLVLLYITLYNTND